jgi:hypothetical protein
VNVLMYAITTISPMQTFFDLYDEKPRRSTDILFGETLITQLTLNNLGSRWDFQSNNIFIRNDEKPRRSTDILFGETLITQLTLTS